MSRPARARGLKLDELVSGIKQPKSRPARARGLKLEAPVYVPPVVVVAPRAGAWIETLILGYLCYCNSVAPRAGAWIETTKAMGLPLRTNVAPRAGAWIETAKACTATCYLMSRPARARGLKPDRSSKRQGKNRVAPRAGAWIETINHHTTSYQEERRAPRGRVD